MAYTDIIVAVHGIGDQQRNATVRSVATRVAGAAVFAPGGLAPQPLGYFHTDVRDVVKVGPLGSGLMAPLDSIGFAEVFWAGIPQEVVKEGHTLEEIKAWGRTIVARARKTFKDAQSRDQRLHGPDFGLAEEVIEEIVETIDVLENLTFLADKAGIMTFDLREVLDEYVGDVQIVTEFTFYRREIIGAFHRAMEQIHEAYPGARLHVIAHSEGTVVGFLGLAHALSGERVVPSAFASIAGPALPWITAVHGFMTLGSPIDKHLLLWERLRTGFDFSAKGLLAPGQIQWRNYYDKGDPVGFDLNTARRWLDERGDTAFDFCNCPQCRHDMGFARYPLPGKAHNDYWDDPGVFEHFLSEVVREQPAEPPWDKRGMRAISSSLPYVLCALLLGLGAFSLYKNVSNFTHPDLDPLQRYIQVMVGGEYNVVDGAAGWRLLRNSLGLAALIAGTTIAARIPRLAIGMHRRAALCWLAGAALYIWLVDLDSRNAIAFFLGDGGLADRLLVRLDFSRLAWWLHNILRDWGPTTGVLLASLVVAAIGVSGTTKPHARGLSGIAERRQRWIRKGARPLIVAGAVVIALFVIAQLLFFPKEGNAAASTGLAKRAMAGEKLEATEVAELVSVHPPVWPMLVAGVFFLYLWWLATLIFDLAFVWNRYVRGGMALRRLRHWGRIAGNPPPPGGAGAGNAGSNPPPPREGPGGELFPEPSETCRRKSDADGTVRVFSREKWNHTGVMLEKDRRYRIEVPPGQTWKDRELVYGPEGGMSKVQRWFWPFLRVKHGARFFTLIGTIGESCRHAFIIGTGPVDYTASVSGELVCFANDCPFAYGNNTGWMFLKVTPLPKIAAAGMLAPPKSPVS